MLSHLLHRHRRLASRHPDRRSDPRTPALPAREPAPLPRMRWHT